MARYNIHAGHNPDGKVACGAVGLIKESTEARKVKDEVIRLLKQEGHTVFDTTVDNGTNANDVLSKIVKKCNANKVDLDISIHFNSGAKDTIGNGNTTGVEVFGYDTKQKNTGDRICSKITALGLKNRGFKVNPNLYVLRNTDSQALLIECCFVDDKDDVGKYNYQTMAKAIVEGILNKTINETKEDPKPIERKYAVIINSYSDIVKARSVSHMLKHDDNLFSEVVPYNGNYAVKIAPLSPRSKAESIQKLVKDKYNAYSDIVEI